MRLIIQEKTFFGEFLRGFYMTFVVFLCGFSLLGNMIQDFRKGIIIGCLGILLVSCANTRDDGSTSAIPTSMPTNTITSTVTPAVIPEGWETYEDTVLGFRISFPDDWYLSPARNEIDEAAITSFDPEQTPDTGGVPNDELKIGVVRFNRDGNRYTTPMPSDVMNSETRMVNGVQATMRTLSNSISVEVPGDEYTFLVQGYPADSVYFDMFTRVLDTFEITQPSNNQVIVTSFSGNDVIESPVEVEGMAPGTWMFEGQMSVRVEDPNRNVLGEDVLKAEGEWMTEELVPFSGTVSFEVPNGLGTGYVVFEKSNPSGMPENEGKVEIPVRF